MSKQPESHSQIKPNSLHIFAEIADTSSIASGLASPYELNTDLITSSSDIFQQDKVTQ